MTFFATLLFGAGALLLISALENQPFQDTLRGVISGNLTISTPTSSGGSNVSGPTAPITGAPYDPSQPGYYPSLPSL